MNRERWGCKQASALALALVAVAFGGLLATGSAQAAPDCLMPQVDDGHEPPCNPELADSRWPAAQRANYQQASSPFPAPTDPSKITIQHPEFQSAPIFMGFTSTYADGGINGWMSTLTIPETGEVIKFDQGSGQVIDTYDLATDEGEPPSNAISSISGAYNVVDADNRFIVGRNQRLDVYGDSVEGDRFSPIALLGRLRLDEALCRDSDRFVGITLMVDGRVAFATEQGVVGTVPRQPARLNAGNLRTISLNGDDCADASIPDEDLETVSNSIAADEADGIYVVTSRAQYKLRAGRDAVTTEWRAEYETGGGGGGARLGAGSGSTPTLMGTGPRDGRFVVITDGQDLVNLVLMWRDEIPADWESIAPGKDRRIACEVPISFGTNAAETNSEQSVLVRGEAAVVVNNELAADQILAALPPQLSPLSVLSGQLPGNAPQGIQRVDWKPQAQRCATRWTNDELSIPNGVPTMSSYTDLFYGIGQQNGVWGLQAVDFDSGKEAFFKPASPEPDYNSFFAGTTVGPGGDVFTGTFGGMTIFRNGEDQEPDLSCAGQPATIVGTGDEDVIRGTSGPDVIRAGRGDDRIRGGAGDDLICANVGRDRVQGGAGDDVIRSGSGDDLIGAGPGDDIVIAGFGNDTARGNRGDDRLHGSRGDDRLLGGPGADRVHQGEGTDRSKP